MFSPNLFRFIIDPENTLEKAGDSADNIKMVSLEKQVLRLSPVDHEKVLYDYAFLSRVIAGCEKLNKGFGILNLRSKTAKS